MLSNNLFIHVVAKNGQLMEDFLAQRGEDRRLININDGGEMERWMHQFSVPYDMLREVIHRKGNEVARIKVHLRMPRTKYALKCLCDPGKYVKWQWTADCRVRYCPFCGSELKLAA